MIMRGYIIHIAALGKRIINFAKIGIIDNLRNSILSRSSKLCDLFLGPSKAAKAKDNGVSTRFLSGTDIRGPGIDGLLDNPHHLNVSKVSFPSVFFPRLP